MHFPERVLFLFLFLVFSSPFLSAQTRQIVVQSSDTGGRLFQKTGVPWPVIVRANPTLAKAGLSPGQKIVLPEKYQVKSGDTLYSLARRWSVSVASLQSWNDLTRKDTLLAGSWIYIPVSVSQQDDRKLWPAPGVPGSPQGPLKIVTFQPQEGSFYSVCDGTVLYKGVYQGLGPVILIEDSQKNVFAFGNFAKGDVEYGQKVKKGENLGTLSAQKGLSFFVSREGKSLNPFEVLKS
jgi:LysM repeat protein